MSRKAKKYKRDVMPDPKFGSVLVSKFINKLMYNGKKSVAEKIFYTALALVKEKIDEDPVEVFKKAFNNIIPSVEVKSKRVGGATYQVPVEVRAARQETLATRWLITYSRTRGEKNMAIRLANEIVDAYNNTGLAVKKKDDTHKMAEANKAFAHFRW